MNDYTELKKAAEYAAQDVTKFADEGEEMRALQQFHEEVDPETVLALIKDLESHKRMLLAAACDLGAIGEALKSDMDADGDELLGMVIDLKAQNTRMLEWLKDISRTSGDKGAVMGARQLLKEFAE
ncbi:hypothetical protein [Pseudomonas sp. R76]|uniref:hypothetical protein n=1 Tax=Pseudomonas sp. R76 TaxID=1573711 RepID=UPI0013200202|nr:hypothetical protein [Pseudomonas sp. R76]QHD05514.1 hypothetical protein PspR76_07130 [Pseudomonas sp. R76]